MYSTVNLPGEDNGSICTYSTVNLPGGDNGSIYIATISFKEKLNMHGKGKIPREEGFLGGQ